MTTVLKIPTTNIPEPIASPMPAVAPDTRGGCQPFDGVSIFENDTGSEKADTADYLGGNARRIGASCSVEDNTGCVC